METIADRLKLIIQAKKLTIVEFSEILGKNKSNVSNILNERQKPASEFLFLLAEKLNVNINWLLTGKGSMFIQKENEPKAEHILGEFRKILKENGIE